MQDLGLQLTRKRTRGSEVPVAHVDRHDRYARCCCDFGGN
jgi:hypothetical protein